VGGAESLLLSVIVPVSIARFAIFDHGAQLRGERGKAGGLVGIGWGFWRVRGFQFSGYIGSARQIERAQHTGEFMCGCLCGLAARIVERLRRTAVAAASRVATRSRISGRNFTQSRSIASRRAASGGISD
jgi:hypothetical protein